MLFFFKTRDYKSLNYFLVGFISNIILFLIFLIITKTPFLNFLYQYILFPLTIGEGRISSSETAYVSFANQLNFKRILGDFKFIHILFIPLILLSLNCLRKK